MKITNPRDVDFTIQVKGGQTYTVLANDSITGVPVEHAEFWKGLHPFMMISEDDGVKAGSVRKSDDSQPVIEEVKKEVVEPVIEEKEKTVDESPVKKETIVDKVKKQAKKVTKK